MDKKIEIDLSGVVFGSKVSGEMIQLDPTKLHATWLTEMLRYGIQRKINDHVAGQGDEKIELARAFAVELQEGNEKPVRVAGGRASVAPEVAMARKTARAMLQAAFAKATGENTLKAIAAKAESDAQFAKIKNYITINANGLPIWDSQNVDTWIAAKPQGRDLIAEAKASIASVDDLDF